MGTREGDGEMPREKINQAGTAFDPHSACSETVGVQVGWARDGHVQLCLEADTKYFTYVTEHPDAPEVGRTTAYSPVLSRSEVNNLIRALRRARDQAYGRDE